MNERALVENVTRHLQAIEVCLQNHCRIPALTLIYVGIDIFASLARHKDKYRATKEDYIDWCEKYLLQKGQFPALESTYMLHVVVLFTPTQWRVN